MKFGQLIEFDMRSTFVENSYTNAVKELSPDPFLKSQDWVYLWINGLKFYEICFYYMLIWGLSKYSETKLQTSCFHIKQSFFKKQKDVWNFVSLPHFLHNFWRKIFFFVIFYQQTKFHCLVAFNSWDIVQYVYYNCLLTRL